MSRFVRMLAIGIVAALGLFGALFVAGEALSDPGGWAGVALVATWLVPMAALVLLALRRPVVAGRVLPWAVLVAGVVLLLDAAGAFPRDTGPVGTVTMFAVAVPCGLLGLRRAFEAGVLLLGAAALQLVAVLVERGGRSGGSLRQALGGSTGALVTPLLVCAALLLLAAVLERYDAHHPHVRALY